MPAGQTPLRVPLLIAAAACALYLFCGFQRDFWAPDEPDFAEHVREMLERGRYLVPYENGKPYGEKPILFYWAVAATTPFSGGDVHPGATRLPSVLSAAFLVFGAAWLAGFRGTREEALLAGAMTAVVPLVLWQGQFLQIDAMFSALLLAGLLAMLLIEEDPEHAGRWRWVFQLILPLAVLTKGPLAIALLGLVAAVRAVNARSWRPILVLGPLRGALVLLALVVPWYVAAAREGGPEYAYNLIVNQNWNRFFHAFDHVQPWWYYLKKIWGDFAPFTPLALAAPFVLQRAGLFRSRPELRFAGIAIVTAFVFLSLSGSKQGKYLLVAYPLAAALTAAAVGELQRRGGGGLRAVRGYVLLVAAALVGGSLALVLITRLRLPQLAPLAPLVAVPLVLGALGVGALLMLRRRDAVPALLALCATFAAAEGVAAAVVFPAIDPLKTGRAIYERIRPAVSHGEPLAYYGPTYHSYAILVLRRRTEHFRNEDDLARWVERTPGARVLVDESVYARFTNPLLRSLTVHDRQPVGQDATLFLGR